MASLVRQWDCLPPPGHPTLDTHPHSGSLTDEMPTDPAPLHHEECLELSVEELLRRARPLPPRDETVIEDLTDEEAEAFFEAIKR